MIISNSPDISTLDFSVLFDISTVTPTIEIGNLSTGPNLDDCTWWYEILTPSGTVIHQGSESLPDETGLWTTINVPDTWPMPFNNQIEFSGNNYVVKLYVKDTLDDIYSLTKEQPICRPNGNVKNVRGNFGVANVRITTQCEKGKMLIEDQTNYVYKGNMGTRVSTSFVVSYPLNPDDGTRPANFTANSLSNAIVPIPYSGDYSLVLNVVNDYLFENSITVRVKFKLVEEFPVLCNIDLCPLVCDVQKLIAQVEDGKCNDSNYDDNKRKLDLITSKLGIALIAKIQPACDIDLPALIEEIKEIGGFTCNCYNTGINTSITGELNIEFDDSCGDIIATVVSNDGSNIVLSIKDKSYVVAITPAMQALGFSVTPTLVGCVKTYTLDWDGTSACCPVMVPVFDDGTDAAPASCPASYFPAQLMNPTRTATIATVNSADEMVSLMNSNGAWSAIATWLSGGNCKVFGIAKTGQTLPDEVYIQIQGCVGNVKVFDKNLLDYCNGTTVASLAYPFNGSVSYTIGGEKYHIGLATDLTDLLARLTAEPNRPIGANAVTYAAGSTQDKIRISIASPDCSQTDTVNIYSDVDNFIQVGANNDGADEVGGIYAVHMDDQSVLGKVCGQPLDSHMWHVRLIGNYLYTIDTLTGELKKFDFSTPLYPALASTVILPSGGGPTTPFNGHQLNTAYMVTDYDPAPTTLYIVESDSGYIWAYSLATDTVIGFFYSELLVNRCPRVALNGVLWLSKDGTRNGQVVPASANWQRKYAKLDLTIFNSGAITEVDIAISGDEPWAMSYEIQTDYLYISTVKGNLIEVTAANGNVNNLYTGVLPDFSAASTLMNSRLFKPTISTRRIFVSALNDGTHWINLDLLPATSSVPFDTQMIKPDGTSFTALGHYNFVPIPGRCYGVLTFNGGADPGGIAKFTYAGKFVSMTPEDEGDIYNVVAFPNVSSTNPNGLC